MTPWLLFVLSIGCADPPPAPAPPITFPDPPTFEPVPVDEALLAEVLNVAFRTATHVVYRQKLPQAVVEREPYVALRPGEQVRSGEAGYAQLRDAEAVAWEALAPSRVWGEQLCSALPSGMRCKVSADSGFEFGVLLGSLVIEGIAAVRDADGRVVVSLATRQRSFDPCAGVLAYHVVLLDGKRSRVLWRGTAETSNWETARGMAQIKGVYMCAEFVPEGTAIP